MIDILRGALQRKCVIPLFLITHMTSIFVSIYTQDILIRLTIIIKPIYIQNIQDIDWLEYMKKKKICSILLVVHLSLWFDIGQYTDVITFTFSQLFPWFVSIWHLFAPACTSLIIYVLRLLLHYYAIIPRLIPIMVIINDYPPPRVNKATMRSGVERGLRPTIPQIQIQIQIQI